MQLAGSDDTPGKVQRSFVANCTPQDDNGWGHLEQIALTECLHRERRCKQRLYDSLAACWKIFTNICRVSLPVCVFWLEG